MQLPKELTTPIKSNATMRFIEALADKLPNERVIPIFGGAAFIDPTDTNAIIDYLPEVIRGAKFWHWSAGLADACRVFCHCLLVDPALIECCIGMKFEELVA